MATPQTSKAILEKLPAYLQVLEELKERNVKTTSSKYIATTLGYGEIQVRKDLAKISGKGRPKIGYVVEALKERVEEILHGRETLNVVLIGAGKLGKAFLGFDGFSHYGLNISASFDSDDSKVDESQNIFKLDKLYEYCKKNNIKMGIITVPEKYAQEVCDKMVSCGITAILNFAPRKLKVPDNVVVRNENMASSLASLAGRL